MLKLFIRFNYWLCDIFCKIFNKVTHANNYNEIVINRIENFILRGTFTRVLEVGGIDRPLIGKAPDREFDGLDIEYSVRMDNIYDRVFIKSIEEPLTETYDLIYSMTLLEHVKDNIKSITSIYNGLNTGGLTVHYIPSKYHPYSIILQMVGPILGKKLVQLFYPESKGLSGYKTFFNKCSPDEMKNVFESCGFSNIELIPFYRTSYFRFFFPLYILILYYENVCEYFKLHKLCSGFIISATK